MRAVVRESYGTPEVLRVVDDEPLPAFGPDDVLVRVRASSLNDYDWHLLTGRPFLNRMVAPVRPKHRILGSDVAGTVHAVGARVMTLRPGDEVIADMSASGFGAFAEFVAAPASTFLRTPPSLPADRAAAVPQAGTLAVTGLRGRRPIREGEAVLVNGGGGGVGTLAIQIAKARGAVVTGIDAAHKLETMRAAGADHVADYRRTDLVRAGRVYDRIIDVAAHVPISTYRALLRPGGYAGLIGGSIPRLLLTAVGGPLTSVGSDRVVALPRWRPNDADDLGVVLRLMEAGDVVPVIDSVVPLQDVADAFRRFGAQQHTGKIVLTV